MKPTSLVQDRQYPLILHYLEDPKTARTTDLALVEGKHLHEPFRTEVVLNQQLRMPFSVAVPPALGGPMNSVTPGDMLCAALATSFETTLRMVANRLEIKLLSTSVLATASADVRGTLLMDTSVPVHYSSMDLDVQVRLHAPDEQPIDKLLQTTKHCCILFRTLERALPINMRTEVW